MPYIKKEIRTRLDGPIVDLARELMADPQDWAGKFNYIITRLVLSIWNRYRSYATGNAIVGVFTCASREFSRRYLDRYEDEKIRTNGDVEPVLVGENTPVMPVDAPNAGSGWTADEDAFLRKFIKRGISVDRIARTFGRSSTAIIYRIVKLDIRYGRKEK